MTRLCVRCRVVAVPDGLHWCPSCLAIVRADESYQTYMQERGHCFDEEDGSREAALERTKET
jgi:hypothetical protein